MSKKRYPDEFKIEAVKQVVDAGHSVADVANCKKGWNVVLSKGESVSSDFSRSLVNRSFSPPDLRFWNDRNTSSGNCGGLSVGAISKACVFSSIWWSTFCMIRG